MQDFVTKSEVSSLISVAQGNLDNLVKIVGDNRLDSWTEIRAIRNELLETLVRSRLAYPYMRSVAAPLKPVSNKLSIEAAFTRLRTLAPLNWELFVNCLDAGTSSYETLPINSCSTEAHPQALLFRAFLKPYLSGNVLDIGCGPQPIPFYLQDYPSDMIYGIDPISTADDHPFHFVQGVGEFLPWNDNSFDVVVSGTTLDHYYLLDLGLKEVFRTLRPGGKFVAWISEFKDAPPYDPYTEAMGAPYDVEHMYHINTEWFLPLMRSLGFREVETINFTLPFDYVFMSFEKPL